MTKIRWAIQTHWTSCIKYIFCNFIWTSSYG